MKPKSLDTLRWLAGLLLAAALAQLSHLEGLTGAKPFKISKGYPRVFTTHKGVGEPILA